MCIFIANSARLFGTFFYSCGKTLVGEIVVGHRLCSGKRDLAISMATTITDTVSRKVLLYTIGNHPPILVL